MSTLKDVYDECKELDEVSSKRNIDPVILKAYINIYRFLYENINDEELIPKLEDSEVINNWLSNRNWLMLPVKGCSNREQAKEAPYPNIWISVDEDLKKMQCGIHWAQANAVYNFLNLVDPLNKENKERLETTFSNMKSAYKIAAQEKIHKKGLAPAAPADFKDFRDWDLKDFDSNIANEILGAIEEIRVKGKELRELGKVEWCVPTVNIEYPKIDADDYKTLLEIVKDFLKIMIICYDTLTQSQIKGIKRNVKREFNYEKLKNDYKRLRFLLELGKITDDIFEQELKKLNEKIEEYNKTFNEHFELLE